MRPHRDGQGSAAARHWHGLGAVVVAIALVGCGAGPTATPQGQPDAPVPANEPRAELSLEVDLPAAQDCEEALDLALYQDRGIELVEWDDARDRCEGRRITVRYLSRKHDATEVLEAVRAHAVRATVAKPERSPKTPPSATVSPPPVAPAPPLSP